MAIDRRNFLETTLAAGIAGLLAPGAVQAEAAAGLKMAPFRFDVTPPVGHPLCGGWITPVKGVDDPLEAIGYVLVGAGEPMVVCAVDWTGLLNEAHGQWRETIAQAAGTSPDRVAVQCVHQHDAPFVCLEGEKVVSAQAGLPHLVQLDFFQQCLKKASQAVGAAMQNLQPVTHIATGHAKVEKVASNRRIVNEAGELVDWRGSSSKVPRHWELPEGLIDPWMKTVAFYHGEKKLVSCHYYATHPMSHYAKGQVSSDFVGLARKRRQAEEQDCTHIYFTGCSGNVAAGKYNDGTPEARARLTERIYAAMVKSESALSPQPIQQVQWATEEVQIPPAESLQEEALLAIVADGSAANANRNRAAMKIGWLRRCEKKMPIVLSALHVNDATLLHLPAESFIEYQLQAQQLAPARFVVTAAYGDGGPWYIPTAEAYPQGGYEVSVAFSAPEVDSILTQGSQKLLDQPTSA
ncbi:hypothetical protein [Bremerella cremea]|nr:hypothetical protein [Bremerella cremea]